MKPRRWFSIKRMLDGHLLVLHTVVSDPAGPRTLAPVGLCWPSFEIGPPRTEAGNSTMPFGSAQDKREGSPESCSPAHRELALTLLAQHLNERPIELLHQLQVPHGAAAPLGESSHGSDSASGRSIALELAGPFAQRFLVGRKLERGEIWHLLDVTIEEWLSRQPFGVPKGTPQGDLLHSNKSEPQMNTDAHR